jgi:uncharacterized protein DUF3300
VPSDLVLAERYLAANGDPAQVANQPWDDSVKSLVRYPNVLRWMDQNLEWTTALGDAFLDQPADVMNSIQALRAEAIAAGNLTDTPQQRVVRERTSFRIVPAEPDVIYVPEYDPEVVYVQPYSEDVGPLLTFSAGFAVGSWLNYDCDWDRRGIYVGHWRPGWNQYRDWDRGDRDRWDRGPTWDRGEQDQNGVPREAGRNWDRGGPGRSNNIVNVVNIDRDTARQWQPSAGSQRRQAQRERSNRANARFSSVNARDANSQPDGASGPSREAPGNASHVPKPSRLDFTSQTTERIRGDSEDSNASNASRGFPPSPNVKPNTAGVANAASGARGKNHKAPAPSVAPNVPGEQEAPLQGGDQNRAPHNLNKHAQGSHQNLGANTAGTPGARGKNHKAPAPSVAPNVPGEQGAPSPSGGQNNTPRNLSKHAQGSHPATGRVNNQPPASPSSVSTQKHQKHIDRSQDSSPESNVALHTSNGQKHAPQSSASRAKQSKPSQQTAAAAHDDQHSKRTAAAAHQDTAPQPSNAPHGKGKGKGGGKTKSNEKKNKDAN